MGLRPGHRPCGSGCGHRRHVPFRQGRGWWPRHRPARRPDGTASPPTTPEGSTSAAPDTLPAAAPTHGHHGGNGWSRGPPCVAAAPDRPPWPASHRWRAGTGRTDRAPPAPPPQRREVPHPPPPRGGGSSVAFRQSGDWRSGTPAASPPRRTATPAAGSYGGSGRFPYGRTARRRRWAPPAPRYYSPRRRWDDPVPCRCRPARSRPRPGRFPPPVPPGRAPPPT